MTAVLHRRLQGGIAVCHKPADGWQHFMAVATLQLCVHSSTGPIVGTRPHLLLMSFRHVPCYWERLALSWAIELDGELCDARLVCQDVPHEPATMTCAFGSAIAYGRVSPQRQRVQMSCRCRFANQLRQCACPHAVRMLWPLTCPAIMAPMVTGAIVIAVGALVEDRLLWRLLP